MSEFKPTNKLRFVNRQSKSNRDTNGEILPDGFVRKTTTKILQQWWEDLSSYDDFTSKVWGIPLGEWRDVPIVDEE